ncbi:hypothetical protein [Microbacterium xylanilyticum]
MLFNARALPRQPDEASRQVSLTTIEESAENALQSIQSLLSLMRVTRPEGADECPAAVQRPRDRSRDLSGHLVEGDGDPDQGVSPTGAHSASRRQASGLSQIQSSRP